MFLDILKFKKAARLIFKYALVERIKFQNGLISTI